MIAAHYSNDRLATYDEYRKGVAAASGCTQYQRLVAEAKINGSDHCKNDQTDVTPPPTAECVDVPGCTQVD
jgi:hypothetical protein